MRDDPSGDVEVTFTVDTRYDQGGPGKGPFYKAGETHSFREDIAERWIRRGRAVRPADYIEPVVEAEAQVEEAPEGTATDEAKGSGPKTDEQPEPEVAAAKPAPAAKPATAAKPKTVTRAKTKPKS